MSTRTGPRVDENDALRAALRTADQSVAREWLVPYRPLNVPEVPFKDPLNTQ
jgi:hypothetical protein